MSNLIFVDFDGTLFDIQRFAQEKARIFKDFGGIDYFKTRPVTKGDLYDYSTHLLEIPKRQRKAVKKHMRGLFAKCGGFLFPDVPGVLLKLSCDSNNKIVLITRGEKEYQGQKVHMAINALGLRPLFDQVEVIQAPTKASRIGEIMEEYEKEGVSFDETYFIDDDPLEHSSIKLLEPFAIRIQIDRYSETGQGGTTNYLVRDLQEAIKIIHDCG